MIQEIKLNISDVLIEPLRYYANKEGDQRVEDLRKLLEGDKSVQRIDGDTSRFGDDKRRVQDIIIKDIDLELELRALDKLSIRELEKINNSVSSIKNEMQDYRKEVESVTELFSLYQWKVDSLLRQLKGRMLKST